MRKGANSWTRFHVTLQCGFFVEIPAIDLVGGATKIAADVILGWLSLLRLYIRPKGGTNFFNLKYA